MRRAALAAWLWLRSARLASRHAGALAFRLLCTESFEEQAELIWSHMRAILAAAGMDCGNIVSLKTYLADPRYDEPNVRVRVKHLGSNPPTSTVACCQLLKPKWKLEIEAIVAT